MTTETKATKQYRLHVLTITTNGFFACDTFQRKLLWNDDYGDRCEKKGTYTFADVLAVHLCLLTNGTVEYNTATKTWSKGDVKADDCEGDEEPKADCVLSFTITKSHTFLCKEDRDFAYSLAAEHMDFDNDHDGSVTNTRLVTNDFTEYAPATLALHKGMK